MNKLKSICGFVILLLTVGCSSNGPEEITQLREGEKYFPMADGDKWYFTSGINHITRTIMGDTLIDGESCKIVDENGATVQAWSVDSAGFKVHLLLGDIFFRPPLPIPFNLKVGTPYSFNSESFFYSGDTLYQGDNFSGTLEFKGYVSRTVPAGSFTGVIKLHYMPDNYDEYYGKGVGLLDDGNYILDSAFIGGTWYR